MLAGHTQAGGPHSLDVEARPLTPGGTASPCCAAPPRSAVQQGGALAEPQQPERQKEALKVMGKPLATNHSGKREAGCAHSTKDLEQDEEPSSAQQRAARKTVRTSASDIKGCKNSCVG